jgi:hypothetical protein
MKITTSAQKTLNLHKDKILKKLVNEVGKEENLKFSKTKNPNLYSAEMKDGSQLYVASFEKENGKGLAMIDHKNINSNKRSTLQKKWKQTLEKIFKNI